MKKPSKVIWNWKKYILNQRMVVSMNMKICQEKSGVSKQDQNQQNVWILVI